MKNAFNLLEERERQRQEQERIDRLQDQEELDRAQNELAGGKLLISRNKNDFSTFLSQIEKEQKHGNHSDEEDYSGKGDFSYPEQEERKVAPSKPQPERKVMKPVQLAQK